MSENVVQNAKFGAKTPFGENLGKNRHFHRL